MNLKPLLIVVLLAGLAVAALAQTPAPPAGAAAPAASGATVPTMKIGVVNIAAFRDNIGEMRLRYEKLQAEFAPTGSRIEAMQTKLVTQQKVLEESGPKMTPPQAKKLADDIEELKRQAQREVEDAQAQAKRREEEETGPVFDKVNQFMAKYAQQRGLTLILEANASTNILLYASAEANITADFISEYNKAYPVTAKSGAPAAALKPAAPAAAKPAPARPAPRKPGAR